MQAIIASYNKNNKSNKFFINNGKFSNDYFGNNNVKIANINNTEMLYIFFASGSNSLWNFSIMNQYNRVTYIADIAYKARFALLANVFVA